MAGAAVELKGISKRFGAIEVLRDIDLEIEPGEFMTLVGPSGCGKSTLLRLIAGFEPQSAGTIAIGGKGVDHLRPKERGVAMVFQNYALYPHMTVFENLSMPLVMRRMSFLQRFPGLGRLVPGNRQIHKEITSEVEGVARQLEIDALFERKPSQLSGGQRQRVALGRAMVRRPGVFLMDEPLSNLDARLRVQMRAELAELHKRLGVTFLYVTHDQVEAMTMSRRIAVMIDGDIVQLGTPTEVYNDPRDLRVAQFIGSPAINVLPGTTDKDGQLKLVGRSFPLRTPKRDTQSLQVGIRPEDVRIYASQDGATEATRIGARIRHTENLGSEFIVYLDPTYEGTSQVTARIAASDFMSLLGPVGQEQIIFLEMPPERLYLFDERGVRIDSAPATRVPAVRKVL